MNANAAYHYLYEKGNVKEQILTLDKPITNQNHKIDLDTIKRDILITDYAVDVLGFRLTQAGQNTLSTAEHDSLRIYPGKNDWYRYSTQKGGTIIDFVMHFEDLNFNDALNKLRDYYYDVQPEKQNNYQSYTKLSTKDIIEAELPAAALDNEKIISYLTKDKLLEPDVVNAFINRGLLYQDTQDNCVFVGKYEDKPLFATRKETKYSNDDKTDIQKSIKEVGIFYGNNSKTLNIIESVFDTMAVMSKSRNPQNEDYLCVNEIEYAEKVLNFHMQKREDAKNYERIVIAFDNDQAGDEATTEIIDYIKQKYPGMEINHSYPLNSKDWNEELILISQKQNDLSQNIKMHEPSADGMSL